MNCGYPTTNSPVTFFPHRVFPSSSGRNKRPGPDQSGLKPRLSGFAENLQKSLL